MPPEIFIGFGGPTGHKITIDISDCLRTHSMIPIAAIPELPESALYLESEEKILRKAATCDGAVMICTRGAYYSRKFRDEAETVLYDADVPVVALVQRSSPVLRILKRRHRIKFEKDRHTEKCEELVSVLNTKMNTQFGGVRLNVEELEIPSTDYPRGST